MVSVIHTLSLFQSIIETKDCKELYESTLTSLERSLTEIINWKEHLEI